MKKNIINPIHLLVLGGFVILSAIGVFFFNLNKSYNNIQTIEDGLQYRNSQISKLSLNYNCEEELKLSIEEMIKHYNLNVPRYYKNIESFNSLIYFEKFYWKEKIFMPINNLEVMEKLQKKCSPQQ